MSHIALLACSTIHHHELNLLSIRGAGRRGGKNSYKVAVFDMARKTFHQAFIRTCICLYIVCACVKQNYSASVDRIALSLPPSMVHLRSFTFLMKSASLS